MIPLIFSNITSYASFDLDMTKRLNIAMSTMSLN